MEYIIVFEQSIRLGLNIGNCVGPFASQAEAEEYLRKAEAEWLVKPPKAKIVGLHSTKA